MTYATKLAGYVCTALALTACIGDVRIDEPEPDAQPAAECSVSSDCPDPPPESCREVACDWTGKLTEKGYPRGCFLVVSEPNSYCYWLEGANDEFTCPGTCSTPDSGSVCQLMEPHCGGYH